MNRSSIALTISLAFAVPMSVFAAASVPCWQSRELAGDPLFFVTSAGDTLAKASLLRVPEKAPVLKSASGEIVYELGRDFTWKPGSRLIVLTKNSRMPFKTLAELHPPPGSPNAYKSTVDGKSWLLYSQGRFFHDLQCAASYTARDDWMPPRVPVAPIEQLQKIRARLAAKQPIKLVVLGDSISTGLNASMTGNAPPQQPGYPGLVAQGLEQRFGSKVTLVNLSVSGMSASWGLSQADAVIKETPDLFLCAFGMNDASGKIHPELFANTLRALVDKVRAAHPGCATIVVSSMTANPEWIHATPPLYPAYAAALEKLTGPGIAAANVTSVWMALLERKQVLDFTGNGLNHPNDFGHRIYADVILGVIGDN